MKSFRFSIFFFIWVASALILLSGCAKNELEELENKERKIISDYLAAHNISEDTRQESGIYYIENVAGTGLTPVQDNYVLINYVGRYLEDGVIRETSYDSLKSEWPLAEKFTYFLYGPVKLQAGYSMPGINEALYLMKEGGKATVILPSETANYDHKPLIYELQLLKVFSHPDTYEDSVLNVYISQNYSDTAQIADTLVWYKVTQNSTSESVFGPNDSIYFNFTGRILDAYGNTVKDDRIFSSNAGNAIVKYKYGSTSVSYKTFLNSNKIPAGLKLAFDSAGFKNLTKASVAMSYKMAYGEKPLVDSKLGYLMMSPYTNVVFDIDVIDIKQAP